VTLREGALHARLFADSPEVNSLLRSKAFELQRMLRRLGLDVDSVSVAVGSDADGTAQGQDTLNQDPAANDEHGFDPKGETWVRDKNSGITRRMAPIDDHWVA
ncbi:flagellar hook-length control protein FliK, partial [Oligoflexia bacterium]|nr:flagellar hook-length control protein FliK [Oligoflexia bacterium]